jgi:peptidyl-Lys metalloendopeptidase
MPRKLNDSEKRTFRAARYAALRSLEYTIGRLNDGDATVARVWMGVSKPQNLKILAQRLGVIFEALQGIHQDQITYDPNMEDYAEVDVDDRAHNILLGRAFFTTETYGNDSRASTLIHEVSHFRDVQNTDDHACGAEECLRLVAQAKEKDGNLYKVLTNAENWENLVSNSY